MIDLCSQVFSHIVQPGSTPSRDPPENTLWGLTATAGPMPKYIMSLPRHLHFNKHSGYVAERVSSRNNILNALAGTPWGQQKETLLMTYKVVGRSIINYAAPVWRTNIRNTNYKNIKYIQNEALRFSTGCHKMSSVDHLHVEANILKVRKHSELLSAQYLDRCLEPANVCRSIITRETPKRRMTETLFTRHRNTVEPSLD